tara:strand:+ start:677 stop:1051 length:375 start_codon:yes stop_codon:yes gene_type:complete
MKINKDLENFLKQEKLTEVFKKEVNAQDCKWDEIEVESLITAMVWNKTSQGFEWWKSVNDTFEKYENTPDIINDTITLSKNKVRKYRSNQGKSPERTKISYKVCFYLGIITILILVSYAIFIQL